MTRRSSSLASTSDHALGQRLAQLIQQSGDTAFEAGVLSRRLQAQLQDLLGADTALLQPLRDLLQRPGFRQLFSLGSQGQVINARDALLRDLAEMYSPMVLARLDAVLQGCLNLPGSGTAVWSAAPQPSGMGYRVATAFASSDNRAVPPSEIAAASPPPTVVAIPTQQTGQGPAAIVIALLALICGALVMALAGVLFTTRTNTATATAPASPATSSPAATAPTVSPTPPAPPAAVPEPVPEATDAPPAPAATAQWQACVDVATQDGPPPQAGETWWPVVGPSEALEASRQHCRGDAFINGSGNLQIASFRDRSTAEAFAQQLTNDRSHPYSFRVGEPTQR